MRLVLPHAVKIENKGAWISRVNRHKHGIKDADDNVSFQIVYNEGQGEYVEERLNFVVGSEYQDAVRRLTGANKYTKGYLDAYILAPLVKMFPQGHNNIMLGFAHPPDAGSNLATVWAIMKGEHVVVHPNGERVVYKIKTWTSVDEPTGGIVRAMTSELRTGDLVEPGEDLLLADIGGKISTLTVVKYGKDLRLTPYFNPDAVFEVGIQDAQSAMRQILRQEHPNHFPQTVTQQVINECIQRKGIKVPLGATKYDFQQEYTEATEVILTAIENVYDVVLARAYNCRVAFCSGGGGGLLHPSLQEMFKQMTMLADFGHEIHLANVRGAHYMHRESIRNGLLNPKTAKDYNRLLSKETLIYTVDGGNSQLKAIAEVYHDNIAGTAIE